MKILVTGGAGFIGSNFVHYWFLNHPEDEVVVLDKLTYAGNLENLKGLRDNPKFSFVKGDICDISLVIETIRGNGIDTIVHFAAQSHVDRSILNAKRELPGEITIGELFDRSLPDDFVLNNIWGTHVLLEASLKEGIKHFHHVSTDEVFGSLPLGSHERWNESTPYAPRSPYSASKAGADHLVRAYFTTYGLPATITNCANNIGPFMFPEKLIPLAITNLLEGKKVPVYTPGNQIREWLYVTDHCRAIDLILEKGKVGETYFIGPDNPELTNLEVIQKLLALMGLGEDRIEYVKDRPGHDQRYAMDWSKINRELGWKPQVKLDEALEKMVKWYKEHEEWWKPLKEKSKEYFEAQYEKR